MQQCARVISASEQTNRRQARQTPPPSGRGQRQPAALLARELRMYLRWSAETSLARGLQAAVRVGVEGHQQAGGAGFTR
eukprot:326556-Hanusia_phi.AAC.1